MANLFRKSRQSYDFPLSERAAVPPTEAVPDATDKGPDSDNKAARSGSTNKVEPLISRENVAARLRDNFVKKTKRDFFLCAGLLILFMVICLAGVVVLNLFIFVDDKELLLRTRRQEVEHGVANPDHS